MSMTISSSQTPVNAYLTQQAAKSTAATNTGASSSSSTSNTSSTDTVTVSDIAQQMATQATSWSSMSQAELKGIFDRTWDTINQFDAQINKEGKGVIYAELPTSGSADELTFAKKAADYIAAIHSSPPGTSANPYAGASREMLTSVMYDESGRYTTSERYAAAAEQQKQDNTYFSNLYAFNSINPDHRAMYQGIMDYYDALSPVEKSVYPAGYREQIGGYLKQQETLFGVLSDQDSDSVKGDMASAFNEDAMSGSGLTLDLDEPIWSQLVALTDKLNSNS